MARMKTTAGLSLLELMVAMTIVAISALVGLTIFIYAQQLAQNADRKEENTTNNHGDQKFDQ